MAGMLPGVEAARRRIHNNNYASPSPTSRLPSLCLYATSKSSMRGSVGREKGLQYDESESMHLGLGVAATQAKTRLDLRFQSTSRNNRSKSSEKFPKLKKCGGKKLRWLKLKWNSSYKCNSC